MSQSTMQRVGAAPNRPVVNASAPQAGQSVHVSALMASVVTLGFDPDQAAAVREGNSLVFIAANGGKVILINFFAVGDEPLPSLALPDGSQVSAGDWLGAVYPDMDLSTAAGPQPDTLASSGANDYLDSAGSLLDGVEKFGDLEGPGLWSNASSRTVEMPPADRLVALGTGGGGSGIPDGGGGDEPAYTPLKTMVLRHYDPLPFENNMGGPDPKGEYDYTARMATGAAGVGNTADGTDVPDAWSGSDFRLNILADDAAMTPEAGTEASVVSGVFAANGGKTSIDANNIHIDVTGQGFEGGSGSSIVGAVFAQGTVEEGETGSEDHQIHHAEATLKADGDINLSMSITGDTGAQDHSGVTYAAVAASDRAHVTLESGDDVSITITDQTTGGALDAAGVFGIYSGYGLRDRDLSKREDFPSDDEYRRYVEQISEQYRNDTEVDWDDESQEYVRGTDSARVDIRAAGDVDVKLDMGSTEGPVSGIRLEYGDAFITAGGDINIATTLSGSHSGEGLAKVSAASILDGGRLEMSAEGDVNLSVHGDGRNMSVLYIGDGPMTEGMEHWYSYENNSGTILGKNVNITGTAGANNAADANEIVGIEMSGKKNKFLLSADEKVTIDVTTLHHGNAGSATGILMQPGTSYNSVSGLFMNAPEVEVAARIKPADADSAGSAPDTTATALHVNAAYARLERGQEDYGGSYIRDEGPMEKLSLIAEGGRWNYGIHVTDNGEEDNYNYASAYVQAKELNIRAAGGYADGSSGSYGVVARGGSDSHDTSVHMTVGKLTITVENPKESVGLLADNGSIGINQTYDDNGGGGYQPLTVIISCAITDPSALPDGTRAVAIEALNGGRVDISSYSDWWSDDGTDDLVSLTGDVHAKGTDYQGNSSITIDLGGGSDTVHIDGNITAEEKGEITINTGADADRIEINGDITADTDGRVSIDAGSGNDVLVFSGKINPSDSLYITGGNGQDLLVLKAATPALFEEQFREWLEHVDLNALSCESIILHGVDPNDVPEWLSEVFSGSGVELQFFGTDTNVTLINAADQLDSSFILNGEGDDDLLYLRFDDAGGGLSSFKNTLDEGKVSGLEKLVLDIANGHDDDGLNGLLNGLISEMKEGGTEVRLRMDDTDVTMLQNNGWTETQETRNIDGTEYTVYNNDDVGELYVRLITSS